MPAAYLFSGILGAAGLMANSKSLLLGATLIAPLFAPLTKATLKMKFANILIFLGIGIAVGVVFKPKPTKEMLRIAEYKDQPTEKIALSVAIPFLGGIALALTEQYAKHAVLLFLVPIAVTIVVSFAMPLVDCGIFLGCKNYHLALPCAEFAALNLFAATFGYMIGMKNVLKN